MTDKSDRSEIETNLTEDLASLAIDLIMDALIGKKSSDELMRDFILGIERLRSEIK